MATAALAGVCTADPDAAYEATLLAGVLNSRQGGSNIVLLTLLGGGAFRECPEWIHTAIQRALDKTQVHRPGCSDGELRAAIAAVAAFVKVWGVGMVSFFPWGKLDRQIDGSVRTHSLIDHMTDVAAVMHRLLHLPAIERAYKRRRAAT